jgi:hypothetical protein
MRKIVYTFILLLLTLTFSNAQWRQFPCTITGNNDFGHSSSVSNNLAGSKKSLVQFNENNQDFSRVLITDTSFDIHITETYSVYCVFNYIPIKFNQANILKRRE